MNPATARRADPRPGRRSAPGGPRAVPLLRLVALVWTVGSAAGCDDDGDGTGASPAFPADYEDSYVEVRNCRPSGDHDLNNIRILAGPLAAAAYEDRMEPFPVDAVVIKEEFDFGDLECAGPIKQWTVMQRLPAGSSDETLGWAWQRVDADRRVLEEDAPRCVACHQGCGVAPDGYEGTCAVP